MNMRKTTVLASLLLFGAAGCADLEVTNLNQPERERVLSTPADVESLIAGSLNSWWYPTVVHTGLRPIMSAASFQHSPRAANFGMVDYSAVPVRPEVDNTTAHTFAIHFERKWYGAYRAISAATQGIVAMGEVNVPNPDRAEAFARFVQGVGHGTLALVYDQAFIFDETVDPLEPQELQPYTAVMEAAIGYLEQAASLSQGATWSIPGSWIGRVDYSADRLARLANSYKAWFRANAARTPGEADGINWAAVRDDALAGLTAADGDFAPVSQEWSGDPWQSHGFLYINFPGAWSQFPMAVFGMADQSGAYQAWRDTPWGDRQPFIVVTPDQRFPQGATRAEQQTAAARGMYIELPGGAFSIFGTEPEHGWAQPERGTWRWSFYRDYRYDSWTLSDAGPQPQLGYRQMQLFLAEAYYRLGDFAAAADIINATRVGNGGLTAAAPVPNSPAANVDCVPRLSDGSCGDLLEMLKWEMRLESMYVGFGSNFFPSRRWGDLMAGSFLHLPVPGQELEVLLLPYYTFGGSPGQPGSAPVGTYGF